MQTVIGQQSSASASAEGGRLAAPSMRYDSISSLASLDWLANIVASLTVHLWRLAHGTVIDTAIRRTDARFAAACPVRARQWSPFGLFLVCKCASLQKIIFQRSAPVSFGQEIGVGKMWLGCGFPKGNAYFAIPKRNVRDFANGVYDGDPILQAWPEYFAHMLDDYLVEVWNRWYRIDTQQLSAGDKSKVKATIERIVGREFDLSKPVQLFKATRSIDTVRPTSTDVKVHTGDL